MILKGNIWKVGDNVDTDIILPGQYLSLSSPEELAAHCMEGIEVEWAAKIKPGDILIAGKNFGCGSSREHAPLALKGCGLGCVIAESFGAIFYRNAINLGFPVIEIPDAANFFKEDQKALININLGNVVNESSGQTLTFKPMPQIILDILNSGGLMEYIGIDNEEV